MKKIYILIIVLCFFVLAYYLINVYTKKPNSTVNSKREKSTPQQLSPISISYLRSLQITSEKPKIEEELSDGSNYKRYIASYLSEGYKVYGLLTVPIGERPNGGYPAIIFNHGYIPPTQYITTEGYAAYVDYLARNGFIVFKIDLRGNGKSEGDPSGSYFSSAYTIDAISALKSLQKFDLVNPKKIGMWGHSMAGNITLRAMLISHEIKVGVIWAGAVYSYEDFAKYGISDTSYAHRPYERKEGVAQKNRETSQEIQQIRSNPKS